MVSEIISDGIYEALTKVRQDTNLGAENYRPT